MGILGGSLGYRLLKLVHTDGENPRLDGSAYKTKSKLDVLLGANFIGEIRNKVVIDFGCGTGAEAVEMARRGASRVIGIDINGSLLKAARLRAERMGVSQICAFTKTGAELADVIVSIDAFEHYENPAAVLEAMRGLLKPGGCVFAAFGPIWYHPLGGHVFSVFPWAHLVFSEKALLRWWDDHKPHRGPRFIDVGLNQMTIKRFERLIEQSPFRFAHFELLPIRRLRWLANRLTREVVTSVVRCKLVPKDEIDPIGKGSETSVAPDGAGV